jgi:hypothetical protein
MKCGRMRRNKREVTIGTAHTVTVNSLIDTNKQTNKRWRVEGQAIVVVLSNPKPLREKVRVHKVGISLSESCQSGIARRIKRARARAELERERTTRSLVVGFDEAGVEAGDGVAR